MIFLKIKALVLLWSHDAANAVMMWVLLGFWGPPLLQQFQVYGTWQLVSPSSTLSVQQRKHIEKRFQSDE